MTAANASGTDKLNALLQWFEDNKVTFNEEAIEVVQHKAAKRGSNIVSSEGFGIVARRNLQLEEPLVVIPKTAVISAATSALANIFFDEDLAGSLALCIAVMYEMSLGKQSPWYGYLQSLPVNADIPILWDAQARKWLDGTDVAKWLERDDTNLKDDFETLQKLVADYPHTFISQNNVDWSSYACFLNVASLVSSRAFSVDVFRGNSMVPFADIFNHKTASEHVHIESEEMVCPLCGEAFGCEHMEGLEAMDADDQSESECGSHGSEDGDDEENGEEVEEEDVGEELPLLVDGNGDPIQEDSIEENVMDGSDDNDEDEQYEDVESDNEEDDGDDDEEEGEDKWLDSLDMVVFKPCKANGEVFNTYGEHGSAYLLHRYGFCDTQNPFESVSLDPEMVFQALAVAKSETRASEVAGLVSAFRDLFVDHHRAKSQDEDETDEEEEDEEEDNDGSTSSNKANSDEQHDDSDVEMSEDSNDNESESESEGGEDMPSFSIDAPGHPSVNLVALLVLGLAEDAVFEQLLDSEDLFRHYFPLMRSFWLAFQERLDAGASVAAALREANKVTTVKKSSAALVCRVSVALAEKRLDALGEDSAKLGTKPADPLQAQRWDNAKQIRSNERKLLQQFIKTYKKCIFKLSG
ncbi:hypothetical protein H4R99_005110 [Coemansia sp. RSA 1722]|nr:hypothetical protein LPJ57_003428 [Coemansia sp. RSA 486]KAJ2595984.1 hypothetical protein H4R99_005110 [Coemansia sp. RSA 1722]